MFKSKFYFFCLVVAAFAGCNSGAGAGSGTEGSRYPEPKPQERTGPINSMAPGSLLYSADLEQECETKDVLLAMTAGERAGHCLKRSCEGVGATFNEALMECDCGPGYSFRASPNEGECLQNVAGNYRGKLAVITASGPRSHLTLQTSDNRSEELDHWVGEYVARNRLGYSANWQRGLRVFIGTGQELHEVLSERLWVEELIALAPYFSVENLNLRAGMGAPELIYYEPKFKFLGAALGDRDEFADLSTADKREFMSLRGLPPARADSQALQEAYESYRLTREVNGTFKPTDIKEASLAGCAEQCFANQSLTLNKSSASFRAAWVRQYFLGAVAQEKIVITEMKTNQTVAFILLNPMGAASIVAFSKLGEISQYSERLGGGYKVTNTFEFFDRYGAKLASHQEVIASVIGSRLRWMDESLIHQKNVVARYPLTVVCEPGWNLDLLQGDEFEGRRNLVLGPLFSKEFPADALRSGKPLASSFFGWTNPKDGDFNDYFSGHLTKNSLNVPVRAVGTHALQIAEVFHGADRSGYVLPLDVDSCLNKDAYPSWKERVVATGTKVAVLASASFQSAEVCANSVSPIFADADKPLLWVIAAGNESIRNPRLGCPEVLVKGSSNTLIVAASENEQLAAYSNYGRDYADIAEISRPYKGTSFAAPRVGRLAADIAFKYPQLSVPLIRTAILLTADIPRVPLDVRSGGTVNAINAMSLADKINGTDAMSRRALAEGSTVVARRLLAPVFCGESKRCREVERRVELAVNNRTLRSVK